MTHMRRHDKNATTTSFDRLGASGSSGGGCEVVECDFSTHRPAQTSELRC